MASKPEDPRSSPAAQTRRILEPSSPFQIPCCGRDQANIRCSRAGKLLCSKCRLVKYCSKECQASHWQEHKVDCKHPYSSTSWQPSWVAERRAPAFMTSSSSIDSVTFASKGNYVWGNVKALDCLNVSRNEGDSAILTNFAFCFAASGDLRNVIKTINGLPDGYNGRCTVLINDHNPLIVARNLVTLQALTSAENSLDEGVELAFHLTYSAFITPNIASKLRRSILSVLNAIRLTHGDILNSGSFQSLPEKKSAVNLAVPKTVIKVLLERAASRLGATTAKKNMHAVVLAPSREDYRGRYLAALKPAHRLSDMRYRRSGVVLPFGMENAEFSEPNCFLFDGSGDWLSSDNANPLFGWDLSDVIAYGKTLGLESEDVYGCFYVYVKAQLLKFAHRIHHFNLEFQVCGIDASALSGKLVEGIPLFEDSTRGPGERFDRIETSNLADYLGTQTVLRDWGRLLRRENKHAALLIYYMNWVRRVKGGLADNAPRNQQTAAMGRSVQFHKNQFTQIPDRYDPKMLHASNSMNAFYNNDHAFNDFLTEQHVTRVCRVLGLNLRTKHRIVPKRSGFTLDSPSSQSYPKFTSDEFYLQDGLSMDNYSDRFTEIEIA